MTSIDQAYQGILEEHDYNAGLLESIDAALFYNTPLMGLIRTSSKMTIQSMQESSIGSAHIKHSRSAVLSSDFKPPWLNTDGVHVPLLGGYVSPDFSVSINNTAMLEHLYTNAEVVEDYHFRKTTMTDDMVISYDVESTQFNGVAVITDPYPGELMAGFRPMGSRAFHLDSLLCPQSLNVMVRGTTDQIFDLVLSNDNAAPTDLVFRGVYSAKISSNPHYFQFTAPDTGIYYLIVGTYPSRIYKVYNEGTSRKTIQSDNPKVIFDAVKGDTITIMIPADTITNYIGFIVK